MDGITADQEMRVKLERCVELLGTYSSAVLTSRLLAEATHGELTPSQLEALIFIRRHGGCSAKALSEGLHISIPSSTRLVDRMVRKGLVDRRESGVDRRLVHLTVTPAGEHTLLQVHEARLLRLRLALETLPPGERDIMLNALEHFLTAALHDVQTVEDCCLHCGSDHEGTCVVNRAHLALAGRPIEHP
ncbi:MAG TPA: MarR family transcriptional regulator [Armatimonadota bacterium]